MVSNGSSASARDTGYAGPDARHARFAGTGGTKPVGAGCRPCHAAAGGGSGSRRADTKPSRTNRQSSTGDARTHNRASGADGGTGAELRRA